jgi:hypothetical protein
VPSDFTIGLGTAILVAVLALILLRGRFGRRPESLRADRLRPDRLPHADPAERWLHGETTPTPPPRDTATRSDADDPGDPDGDAAP